MMEFLQQWPAVLANLLQTSRNIRFEWPWALALWALIPIFWVLYRNRQLKKIQQTALQFSRVALVQQLGHKVSWWKRLLWPIGLSSLATLMILALAQPQLKTQIPVQSVDMMIVMDISISMMAEDIKPSRMEAAKLAAIHFIQSLPEDIRVGLEWFAGNTYVLSPPTRNHEELIGYIQELEMKDLKPRTELGTALKTALEVLQREAVKPSSQTEKIQTGLKPALPSASQKQKPAEPSSRKQSNPQDRKTTSVPPTKPVRQVIVLLSDGDSHEGYPWQQAATEARDNRVAVFTIGIGSQEGASIQYQGQVYPVSFDENTMKQIAIQAQGEYFRVFSKGDFRKVYQRVREKTVHTETRTLPLGFILAGIQLILLLGLILLWLTL
jgi:Ca-activated chloride channel homolog